MSITYEKHKLYSDAILIRNFSGKVDVNEIIDSWKYLIKNKLIHDDIKGVINNLKGCDLSMNMVSFRKLISYLKKQDYLKKICLAVVSDNPKTIVFPILGENEHELKIKAFTTMNAAVKWIMNK